MKAMFSHTGGRGPGRSRWLAGLLVGLSVLLAGGAGHAAELERLFCYATDRTGQPSAEVERGDYFQPRFFYAVQDALPGEVLRVQFGVEGCPACQGADGEFQVELFPSVEGTQSGVMTASPVRVLARPSLDPVGRLRLRCRVSLEGLDGSLASLEDTTLLTYR